jgi:hypothetical protein
MVNVPRLSKLAAMMTLAVVLGALGAGAAPAKPATVDVFGYYYLRENEAPKGFQDISELYLSTVDYRDGKEVRVPLNGFIRLKPKKGKGAESAVDFPLVAPTRKDRSLVFTTREVGGVSYRFAGTFVKLGNFPEERPEDEVILKGHLTRLQGGKVVAEGDVGFRYTGGD